jgi:hypothetical protein
MADAGLKVPNHRFCSATPGILKIHALSHCPMYRHPMYKQQWYMAVGTLGNTGLDHKRLHS